MDCPIGFWIGDDNSRFGERHVFRMPHLMRFAIRHSNYKWLERFSPQPFSNGFHVHTGNSTSVASEGQTFDESLAVETSGIEPPTPGLQSRCSPN